MMITLTHRALLFLGIVLCARLADARGQSVTLLGNVADTVSLSPLDSARVVIINRDNPDEQYAVYTNAAGDWWLTFIPDDVAEQEAVPSSFALGQNYPNPFNPSTTIAFTVPSTGRVTVRVTTILGQVLDAASADLQAGSYTITWTSRGSSGVLLYTVEEAGTRLTRKMVQLDGHDGGGLGQFMPAGSGPHLPPRHLSRTLLNPLYDVIATKFGYEPDTLTVEVVNGARADFLLQTVHRRTFLIDLHNDVLSKAVDGYDMGVRHTFNHSDLPRFHDGGVNAQMLAAWVSPTAFPDHPYERAIAMIDTFDVQCARNAATMVQARTADEILQAYAEGKFAGILAVEGGHAIEDDLAKLVAFHARGVRYMTITWNNSTSWATSAADPLSATQGLSDFGRQVIRTMDSLGMIIDVAHTGIRTIEDILAVSTNPIVDTHAGARALRNHTRNLTDTQIQAIAQRGGVIGVCFYPPFLTASTTATIDTVVKHIDYIRNLVGIDYIAIGSDFDGIEATPIGLENVSRFPGLTLALLRKGYTSAEIRKIYGENFLRVFRSVVH